MEFEREQEKNTKSWLFEKINKVDKPAVKLAKKKMRENKLLISEMKEVITIDPWTLKRYKDYEQPYSLKFDNLHDMHQFLERDK